MIGTRYAIVVVRFLVDFANKEDVQQVHALQDKVTLGQDRPGSFEVPDWDEASLQKVKAALLQLQRSVVYQSSRGDRCGMAGNGEGLFFQSRNSKGRLCRP